jgi:uncharacterized protein (DUF736 family)
MQFEFELLFEPNPQHNRGDPNSPSHMVCVTCKHGKVVEVGAAWRREIERGPNAGQCFYSFSVDDPSLAAPLNLSAFLDLTIDQETGPNAPVVHAVVWRRERLAAS